MSDLNTVAQAMHIAFGFTDAQNSFARSIGKAAYPWRIMDDIKENLGYGWDGVVLEFFAPLAPIVAERLAAEWMLAQDEGFSGVWEYEVTEPLGAWLFKTTIENKDFPTLDQAKAKLDQLVKDFIG